MTSDPPRPAPVRARPARRRHRGRGQSRAAPMAEAEAGLEGAVAAAAAAAELDRPAARACSRWASSAPASSRRSTMSAACSRPTRWLGWPFAIFLGMALFALTAFATGEIADMRRLSRRAATRAAADRIAASELHGEAEPLLATAGARQFADRPRLGASDRAVQRPAPRRDERRRAAAPVRAPGAGAGRPRRLPAGAAEQPRHRPAHRPQPPGPARRRAGAVAHQHPVPLDRPPLRHGARARP